jgi:hypothetical protein
MLETTHSYVSHAHHINQNNHLKEATQLTLLSKSFSFYPKSGRFSTTFSAFATESVSKIAVFKMVNIKVGVFSKRQAKSLNFPSP